MSNDLLIAALSDLYDIYDVLGETYKASALHFAIGKLKNIDYKITVENTHRLKRIAGIGPGIFNKVEEFLQKGELAELNNLRTDPRIHAYKELGGILGAGPQTIKRWISSGISTLVDLRKAVGADKVKLTNMQKWGLRYYEDLNTRIPRAEVTALGDLVRRRLLALDPNIIFEIAGSYRRGKQDSGDIDIIVSNREHFEKNLLGSFSTYMAEDPRFIAIIGIGNERLTFLYKSRLSERVRQIDILNIAYDSYYAALMYFTGSYSFNTIIRGEAKNKGYRLNQNGLFKVQKNGKLRLIPTKNEKEIFELIGHKYVPPHARE